MAHGVADEPEDALPEMLQAAIDDAHAILERARSAGRTPWGGVRPMPPFLTRMRFRFARFLGRSFLPVISQPVEHGDVLTLGRREWFVTHTPGHTGDHICLHDPESGVLLSGDHVLPTITPHIGGINSPPHPPPPVFFSLHPGPKIPGIPPGLPPPRHPF